ncbi:hypothetical protein HY346_03080 [Candidatus Microgenomates bacterium]|nr:hypothetical protein [Candidatus Microgenomates bacterium]
MLVMGLQFAPFLVTAADTPRDIICKNVGDPNCNPAKPAQAENQLIDSIVNSLSYALGAVSVLVIVISAITLVTAGSNPDTAKKARQAILYAAVGLAVAVAARFIIKFVITRVIV